MFCLGMHFCDSPITPLLQCANKSFKRSSSCQEKYVPPLPPSAHLCGCHGGLCFFKRTEFGTRRTQAEHSAGDCKRMGTPRGSERGLQGTTPLAAAAAPGKCLEEIGGAR